MSVVHIALLKPIRLSLIASLSFLAASVSALADGRDVIERWAAAYRALGLQATYERVDIDGAITRLVGPELTYENTFDLNFAGPGGDPIAVAMRITATLRGGQFEYDDLREEEDGYRIGALRLSDDTAIGIAVSIEPKAPESDQEQFDWSMHITLTGAAAKDVFEPKPRAVANANPSALYIAIIEYLTRFESAQYDVARMETRLVQPDVEQISVYNDVALSDMKDGKVGVYRIGRFEQTQQVALAQTAGEQGIPPSTIVMSYDDGITEATDLRPILDFLKGAAGTNFQPVVKTSRLRNLSMAASQEAIPVFSVKLDTLTIDGIYVRGQGSKPSTVPIEFFDMLFAGNQIEPMTMANAALDLLSAFKVDRYVLEGMSGEIYGSGTVSLASTTFETMSADGLGLISLKGFDWSGRNDSNARFAHIRIGDVAFPDLRTFFALALASENGQIDPVTAITLLSPKVGLVSIGDVLVDLPGQPPIALQSLDLTQTDFVGAIPGEIAFKTVDAVAPTRLLGREIADLFATLGLDAARLNADWRIRWEEDSQDLVVERMTTSISGGGAIDFSARFGGVPRAVLENPQQAGPGLLATLTFKGLTLSIDDAALLGAALERMAAQQTSSVADMRASLLAQLDAGPPPLRAIMDKSAFGGDLKQALATFLETQGRLDLTLEPERTVSVAEIIGLMAAAPESLPQLLGASVSAR